MIQVQETMAHKYNKRRRKSPNFSKGDRVWVRRQRKNLGDKTCSYWDGPYEVVAKKAHDLYVIQVDQRRLVGVHVDCLMKTVNSPRSPVPLNYTEEVARVPSQFEEDTYNVKIKLVHRTHRKSLLFKVRSEGYTKDWDTEEPLKPFYRPTIRFGEITCRNRISPKPLTSSPTLVTLSHERATKIKP